jgi:8-oxo-dGTP diphosphatase
VDGLAADGAGVASRIAKNRAVTSELVPAIGTAVVAIRAGKMLLGKRIAAHGNGMWQIPGGKPDPGETVLWTALRELEEETGLRGRDPVLLASQRDDFPEIGKRYTTFFIGVREPEGEVVNREPDKCEGWEWFALDALPAPLFAIDESTLAAIRDFASSS